MSLKIASVFVLLATLAFSASKELDLRTRELMDKIDHKFAEFQCYKEKSCQHGDKKVCGIDQISNELAVFEDICTMYRANCKKVGKYLRVTMDACDAKKKYEAEHGDKFDWQPIPVIASNRGDSRTVQNHTNNSENIDPIKKHFKIVKDKQSAVA